MGGARRIAGRPDVPGARAQVLVDLDEAAVGQTDACLGKADACGTGARPTATRMSAAATASPEDSVNGDWCRRPPWRCLGRLTEPQGDPGFDEFRSIAAATSASSRGRRWSPRWMMVTLTPTVFRKSANSQPTSRRRAR